MGVILMAKKRNLKKIAKAAVYAAAPFAAAGELVGKAVKKVGKRISCVEKGKKRGLTHREAVKFCAGGKVPGKLKAKPPSKIRRS